MNTPQPNSSGSLHPVYSAVIAKPVEVRSHAFDVGWVIQTKPEIPPVFGFKLGRRRVTGRVQVLFKLGVKRIAFKWVVLTATERLVLRRGWLPTKYWLKPNR